MVGESDRREQARSFILDRWAWFRRQRTLQLRNQSRRFRRRKQILAPIEDQSCLPRVGIRGRSRFEGPLDRQPPVILVITHPVIQRLGKPWLQERGAAAHQQIELLPAQ